VSSRITLTNRILQGLPPTEFKRIFPSLKLVTLPLHSVLNHESKTITQKYRQQTNQSGARIN
jgi:hypothetical protein